MLSRLILSVGINKVDYQQLFRQLPGAMMCILVPEADGRLRIFDVNDTFEESTATKRANIVGKHVFEVFPHNPDAGAEDQSNQVHNLINKARATKKLQALEFFKYNIPDGNGGMMEKYWSLVDFPLLDSDGNISAIMHKSLDVTDLVKLKKASQINEELSRRLVEVNNDATNSEVALEKANDTLKVLNHQLSEAMEKCTIVAKSKAEFLANISHEMRTPLNAILGFSNLLERDSSIRGPSAEFVQSIWISGKHLSDLINDLLDLVKIDAGKLRMMNQKCKLRNLLNDVTAIFYPQCHSKKIALTAEISAQLPEVVNTDPLRLRQVVMNLLSNAVKFTEKGKVNLKATLVSVKDEIATIEIEVKDTGIGISKEDQAKLFQRFEQVGARKPAMGGTGLGLSIAKELARLLNGNLSMVSQPGVGSTFTVQLSVPIVGQSDVQEAENLRQYYAKPQFANLPILVVDDVPFNCQVMIAILRELGFTSVDEASDGVEALKLLGQKIYSVVFTDIYMPNMDGFELAKAIRSKASEATSLVAMTASILNDDNALATAFDSVLSKPVEICQVIDVLKKVANFDFIEMKRAPLRLLVVDDQASIRRLVSLSFINAGDDVVACASGAEAIDKLKDQANNFDVILIDRLMPIMDGIETARRIRREIPEHPKIIIMSADISEEDGIECDEVADGTLEKPIKLNEFDSLWAKLSKTDSRSRDMSL